MFSWRPAPRLLVAPVRRVGLSADGRTLMVRGFVRWKMIPFEPAMTCFIDIRNDGSDVGPSRPLYRVLLRGQIRLHAVLVTTSLWEASLVRGEVERALNAAIVH